MMSNNNNKSFQSVNNDGVQALHDGGHQHVEYATKTLFPEAIRLVKLELLRLQEEEEKMELLLATKTNNKKNIHDDDDDDEDVIIQLLEKSKTQTMEIPLLPSATTTPVDNSSTIVFHQAIIMPEIVLNANAKYNTFYLNLSTMVTIYNLALGFHLLAEEKKNEKLFKKAEDLYDIILEKLVKFEETDDDLLLMMKVHTALLIKLACIANKTQIRRRRIAEGDEDEIRNELLQHLSFFMQQGPTTNQHLFYELEEKKYESNSSSSSDSSDSDNDGDSNDNDDVDPLPSLLKKTILLVHAPCASPSADTTKSTTATTTRRNLKQTMTPSAA